MSYVVAPYFIDGTVFANNTVAAKVERMSYLTLNGIDESDYVGQVSWFPK